MFIKYGFCGYPGPTPFFNRMIMEDGTIHPIDDAYLFAFTGSTDLNHAFVSNGSRVSVVKDNVAEVHIRIPFLTTRTLFCYRLFASYSNPNGTLIDIEFEYDVSTEITIQDGYTDFMNQMFYLSNIIFPEDSNFTIPPNITRVYGINFCRSMFQGCTIQNFPRSFTLMPKLYWVAETFCYAMFLSSNFGTALPAGFNLPGIIEWEDSAPYLNYCGAMFTNCTQLIGLPRNFKFTENTPPRQSQSDIYIQMFYNCSNLRPGTSDSVALHFPFQSIDCFGGTCPITPSSPTAGSTVYIQVAEW